MVDVIKSVKSVTSHKLFPYVVVGAIGAAALWYVFGMSRMATPSYRINPIPVFRQTPAYLNEPTYPITYRADVGRAAPYLGWDPQTPHY